MTYIAVCTMLSPRTGTVSEIQGWLVIQQPICLPSNEQETPFTTCTVNMLLFHFAWDTLMVALNGDNLYVHKQRPCKIINS
jgi:hypothetical protein